MPAAESVAHVLDGARRPALVVSDLAVTAPDDTVTVLVPGSPKPDGQFRTVVLVAADADDLGAVVARTTDVGWARTIAVVMADDATPVVRPHPRWTPLADVDLRPGSARLEFADRTEVAPVLAAFVRAGRAGGHGGVRVARPGTTSDDPAALHPPDVVVDPSMPPTVSEVTGRAPTVVTRDELADLGEPLDDRVYSPTGFRREWGRGVVELDAGTRLTRSLVRDLRDAQGVRLVEGQGFEAPSSHLNRRLRAGLAMSGVPLVDDHTDPAVLDDALRREELSVRQRRAALVAHATLSRRARLAGRAGVRAALHPSVSIVLPTRRPDLLGHALAQVTRQRVDLPGAEVELVLAAHGFTPDPDLVDAAAELGGVRTTIVEAAADTLFGDLLRLATDAAGGELVLKMDDDDWYGPDVVTDLLLARAYSGADVVGMPAELVYLEQVDTTVRRAGPSENVGSVVAGGTMMIDRSYLRELGGWRPARRFVDAHVLDAVHRAGGSVYRTHGLGYVLRRTATGHTWDPGLDYFLRPESLSARWEGFRPSALMELA